MTWQLNRRSFVISSAASTAALTVPGVSWAGASSQVRVAVIGVAGRGASNLAGIAAAGAKVAYLCDVDEPRAAAARKQFQTPSSPRTSAPFWIRKMSTRL